LKGFDKTIVNEVVDMQPKRKTPEPSSSSISFQNKEQVVTVVRKKIKVVEQDNSVICDSDSEENKENVEDEFFLKLSVYKSVLNMLFCKAFLLFYSLLYVLNNMLFQ
jgi:hypothetical protein